jgi:hypothetical protein
VPGRGQSDDPAANNDKIKLHRYSMRVAGPICCNSFRRS